MLPVKPVYRCSAELRLRKGGINRQMAKKTQLQTDVLVKRVDHQCFFDSCKRQEVVLKPGGSMSDVYTPYHNFSWVSVGAQGLAVSGWPDF